jgi:hypothetical protein
MAEMEKRDLDVSYEGKPSDIERRDNLRLMYDCTVHKSNSYKNPKEMWAFACKTEDVMFRMLRFIPSRIRQEIQDHYKEMDLKLEDNKRTEQPAEVRERKEVEIMFQYAMPIHEHNMKLLPMSSTIQRDLEGELDVTKQEVLDLIRGGRRGDDATAHYSR